MMGAKKASWVWSVLAFALLMGLGLPAPTVASSKPRFKFEVRTLDGSGNNLANRKWGMADTPYQRAAAPVYGNGIGTQAPGPNPRYISNRVFNDLGQNLFSERDVTQWVWTWGQFMDHTFGLAESSEAGAPIEFDADDPLEDFTNDLGEIDFMRDAAARGTGNSAEAPRQQVNTVSSYIDGWSVYGGTRERLEWLRRGKVNGKLGDNGAALLMDDGYLPTADRRPDSTAPEMALGGMLSGRPEAAVIAGDQRANENFALTATHTLFAREHNRIVDELPRKLPDGVKFQIARRVVGAEQQYVTYNEFLPAVGVELAPYAGYRNDVDASLGNEFAAVGYRAHSMIHGEFEAVVDAAEYDAGRLAGLAASGVEVETLPDGQLELVIPLGAAFFNPGLVPQVGLGESLKGLGGEAQYKNDEQIDNALRSLLFVVPGPEAADPVACFSDPTADGCFQGVVDLGALDIQRGRDHGIPGYNDLRRAFGLAPKPTFQAITGESTSTFPVGGGISRTNPIDDPDILDFTAILDGAGGPLSLDPAANEGAVTGVRRSTLAARLRAIYDDDIESVDAFVGMVAEPHLPGSELGELQHAMWKRQFEALRDGDRFFYGNDPVLRKIDRRFGITYRHSLAELIALNTDVRAAELPEDVFFAAD